MLTVYLPPRPPQFLLLTVYYCERVLTVNKRVHLISRQVVQRHEGVH